MTNIITTSFIAVELADLMGTDHSVVEAARVSVIGFNEDTKDNAGDRGLINYLMSHRHGTPFEHAVMKFRVHAPLFVYREWHRHRVGWSYNEESGRYKQLEPVFHVPARMRPLINVGTSARPRLTHGSEAQYKALVDRMTTQYEEAYEAYEASLEDGIAKEVARSVLPVGIYSSMYATANLRSIMHFLSLRTDSTVAMFPSKPQYEIAEAAERVEHLFHINFPDTHNAWHTNGRVAP